MRPSAAVKVLLAGLLTGGLIATGVTPALATLHHGVAQPVSSAATGASTPCSPRPALVDPDATPAARCLATRIDSWRSAARMGVGQQLNVSNDRYLDPLDALDGSRVSVVGFDLEELDKAANYAYPFDDRVIADLTRLAGEGVVLNATWHADNPHTGGANHDRSWHDLSALLDPVTPEYQQFWADFDTKMAFLRRLDEAGTAVVFRPFHEANGDWFWWGRPDPATYKKLWRAMQERAWNVDGVHNIVWAYSFNAVTNKTISDPTKLVPAKVDLAGMDSYDDESAGHTKDAFSTSGYAAVAAKVKRMAITEAGPMGSTNGAWNPSIISNTARRLASRPAWAMLWYDDSDGEKQVASLRGGSAWLDSCINAFCALR